MAHSDKNIIITPNIGSTTANPQIVFSGADATLGPQNITLRAYPTSSGTLSFEGSAGQLFSITNSLTGTIFSVNDISGIPSIEVLDTGLVKLAQYSGNVLIGTGTDNGTNKLQVTGSILASGSISGTSFIGAGTGLTGTATSLSIGGNAATATTAVSATTASTVTMAAGRTDVAAYPVVWGTTGSTSQLYSATAVNIQSSTGTLSATTFSGAGTGLTGTAAGLSIGGNAATATSATSATLAANTSSISSAVGGAYTWTGVQFFQSNQNTTGSNPPLQAFASSGGAIMSFHRSGVYAINMGLDSDNVFRLGGWSAPANLLQMSMTGNLTMLGTVAGTNITTGGNVTGTATGLSATLAVASGGTGVTTSTGTGSVVLSASPTFTGTIGAANLTLSGDLTVNGTTTTINSTTISVDDKNIELGSVASPTNVTADGGGITLKGATDKTFNWVSATGAWTSSENIALAAGKDLILNGLTSGSVTLIVPDIAGSNTVSLPAVSGTVITTGDTGSVTNTMLAGSIANAKLANSAITIGSTAISLGATSTTLGGLTSVISTSMAIAGNGSSTDPYGTMAVTEPNNANNYSYYGLTRAGQIGAGFGITGTTGALGLGQNSYWFGGATSGTAGVMSAAWVAFNGSSFATSGTIAATGTISGTNITTGGNVTGTAAGLSATLVATQGGTGQSTYAIGDLLQGGATNTLTKLSAVATGNVLLSGGVTTASSWGKVGLTTHVSGQLPIANGGTNGTATPTLGGVAYGTGTAYAITSAGTSGQVLTSNGAAAPTWQSASVNTYTRLSFTATAGQTVFTVTYTVGYVQVYLNGVLLNSTDYTASSGTSITLVEAAGVGDLLEVLSYNTLSIAGAVTNVSGAGTVSGLTLTGTVTSTGSLTLGGSITSPVSGNWWNNGYTKVATDGVVEVGRYLDFHSTNAGTSDFDVRLDCTGSNAITFGGAAVTASSLICNSATGAIVAPVGTTAQRPSAVQGTIRFNTTNGTFEGYDGVAWGSIGGGATGGGVFYENNLVLTQSYVINTGKGVMSTGPITLNPGVTVTIPNNSRWVIL